MKKLLLIGSCLILPLLSNTASAVIISWDPNGTSSVGGNGTWDTTTAEWSTSTTEAQVASGSLVAWNTADAACFCAGPSSSSSQGTFTVAVNSQIKFAGIFNGAQPPGPCTLTLTGTGTLNLNSGLQGFSTYNSSLGFTHISVPITGTGIVCPQESGQLYLDAVNTYTGGTTLGFSGSSFTGLVNFNSTSSFGTGPIMLSNCPSGALVAEGTSPITITNAFIINQPANQSLNIVGTVSGTTFTGPWSLGAETPRIGSGGGAGHTVILSGVISGTTGGFVVWNTGTVEFNNAMTYTGSTLVSNTVTLALGPSGSIGRSAVTVMSGTTLADLNASGASGIGGAVTLSSGGLAKFAGGGGSVGSLSVGGNLSLNNNAITINVTGSALTGGTYTLMSCAGTVSGSVASTATITGIALPSGYVATITTTTGSHGHVDLNIVQPPTVSISPSVVSETSGGTHVITATTTGTQLTYQWQLNGGPLTGDAVGSQTSSSLTISPVTDADAGTYTVTVSNPANTVSASQYLVVVDPPTYINGQFTLNFSGPVDTGYRIWSTTNLALPVFGTAPNGWTLLADSVGNQFQSGPNSFTDTSATSTNGEYYCITVP